MSDFEMQNNQKSEAADRAGAAEAAAAPEVEEDTGLRAHVAPGLSSCQAFGVMAYIIMVLVPLTAALSIALGIPQMVLWVVVYGRDPALAFELLF